MENSNQTGAGYRDGFAFFPIMGFGTGFMALTFWLIGRKIRRVGRQHLLVTPPELVKHLYQSPLLSLIFALVMIIFTIPYLALQPMAAGYALEALLGLPYFYGCVVVTVIILAYTLRGGLRAVAWTDLFQGSFMFILLVAALIMIAGHHGGFVEANQKVLASNPELFSRPGGLGKYSPGIWFSFIVLWFFCDPMFPQLFQRFFSAKNERSIARIMILYPLVCTVVFFMPITVGVLGRLSFPGLIGKQADRILPMVLTAISGDIMAALVIAAGLAALMSTMDSQLLTLSSIFTRDVVPLFGKPRSNTSVPGRIFVILLSLAGLALAYKPPATILQIATQTFSGLAVLFPTVIFGLYFKRVYPLAAILSILGGEGVLIGFYTKLLATDTFLPVIWVMLITFAVYLTTHATLSWRESAWQIRLPQWLYDRYVWIFLGIFILAMDFWAWEKAEPLFWGIPLWVGYFLVLSALQTVVMVYLVRRKFKRQDLPSEQHRSGGQPGPEGVC
jgi:SSS family solute:Na+ symporter